MISYVCVCLKIGYTPKMVHLIGKIMMNHKIWKYPIFRQSHIMALSQTWAYPKIA